MTRQARFTPTVLYLLSATLVWAAFFLAGYGIVAALCAGGLSQRTVSGVPITHLVVAVAALIALVIVIGLTLRASALAKAAVAAPSGFVENLVFLQGILAVTAIAWNLLPLIFLDGCSFQEQLFP